MIPVNKKLTLKFKLNKSVFEQLNKTAYATQMRSLGTSRHIVNTILAHPTFCDNVLPIIVGNNKLNSDWEKEKYEYISSIQLAIPTNGVTLNLNSVLDINNPNTKSNLETYIEEHNLYADEEKSKIKSEADIAKHILANKHIKEIDLHQYFKFSSPKDYLYWIVAIYSSQVANTIEDVNKSPNIRFFLYDEKVARKADMDNSKIELQALNKLNAIKQGSDALSVMRSISVINNVIPYDELEELDVEDIYLLLYKYVKTNPSDFLKTAEDKDIAIQSKVRLYLESNIFIISTDGDIVLASDNDTVIGKDINAAVSYFKNPTNKGELLKFEGAYKSLKIK